MEHVERSFYEDWADKVRKLEWYTESDPLGNKLLWGHYDPAYHPWNKVTIPKPGVKDWAGKYTWDAHVRIVWKNGKIVPVEVGPYANLLATALQPSDFGPGNGVLKVTLPRACTDELPPAVCDEMTFEWRVPLKSTTIYRLWARAFKVPVSIHASWVNVLKALELVRAGKVKASRPWRAPGRITRGVGFTEAPRGAVRHWIVQKGGRTLNIQIHAPTTVNVSPQDKWGLGSFEQSVANSWVTEEIEPKEWQGLDFVRAIRSFDPCLPCAVHVQFVEGNRIVKDVEKMLRQVECPI
jgi:hydrogenase large subunit